MEWIFVVALVAAGVIVLWARSRADDPVARNAREGGVRAEAVATTVRRRLDVLPEGVDPLDLRQLSSLRVRVVGTSYASDPHANASNEYVLVREPRNRHDRNALAVFGSGRRVGYVSAARAAKLAPLLDQLESEHFLVAGTTSLDIDVPRVPALRQFVETGRVLSGSVEEKPKRDRQRVSHVVGTTPPGYARDLHAAGTPPFNGFSARHPISERIAEVAVGDTLTLRRDAGSCSSPMTAACSVTHDGRLVSRPIIRPRD